MRDEVAAIRLYRRFCGPNQAETVLTLSQQPPHGKNHFVFTLALYRACQGPRLLRFGMIALRDEFIGLCDDSDSA